MRVLVADPDPSFRSLIRIRLTLRQHQVSEKNTSEEVLRFLERERVDIILLSSSLSRLGGKPLIEKIRQNSHWATIPVVLMTEPERISELVLSRERGFDDFLVKPFDTLSLELRLSLNVERAQHRVEANALTHLPGNAAIERAIREKIEEGAKFSVLYIDINHFKSFNDHYGFEKGDDVIRQTAKILVQTGKAVTSEAGCFIAHIGGDDFVIVLDPSFEEPFARLFISEFDRIIPTYYNAEDQKRGSIQVTNRRGKREKFPLMSCAVAACNNLHHPYRSLGEIARDTAEVKRFLKSQPGSHYLRDRRAAPMRDLKEALEVLKPAEGSELEKVDPLGQILLRAGLISEAQLSAALKKHLETGRRLGQVLISMNAVRTEEVGRMLEKKLNVPYVSLKRTPPPPALLRLFTREFIEAHRAVPVEIVGDGQALAVKVAMCDPFDLKTLDTMERMTNLKLVPCLALEDEFEEFLSRPETPKERSG